MSDSTFITRVVLENFRSIAACDVRLGPLMFLVGPNGAGKSNFLDALRFVKEGLVASLEHAIRQRGGSRQIFHRPAGDSATMAIRLEFVLPSQHHGYYAFRLGHTRANLLPARWEILTEECEVTASASSARVAFFRVGAGQAETTGPPQATDRLYLVYASATPQFREVYDALCSMQFYDLQPKSIPDIETFEPGHWLRPDGSNLANTLAVLKSAQPGAKKRVEEFMRALLPGLAQVRVEPVIVEGHSQGQERQRIALVFPQKMNGAVPLFGPSQMSEGTLRALGILTALYQVEPYDKRRPALTGIEDVEAAVHPGALRVILDALQEASLTTQVVVTTHSPELLDDKDVAAESILAVTAPGGSTRIGPLADGDRTVVRERLFTVGQLLRATPLEPAPGPTNQAESGPRPREEAGA